MSISRRGFTFVEVTIAIAILAFALVAMLGLLSVGLNDEKKSAEDTRIASLASYVITSERTNAFSAVSQFNYNNTYYFDGAGNVTNTAPPASYYIECVVNNTMMAAATNYVSGSPSVSANYLFLTNYVNPAGATNLVTMRAVFTYPRSAPAASQKTNVFFFNRSNE